MNNENMLEQMKEINMYNRQNSKSYNFDNNKKSMIEGINKDQNRQRIKSSEY